MAIARFLPGMYRRFLEEHATFTLPDVDNEDALADEPIDDCLKVYPHYTLFMAIHLGSAFYDEEIEHNIKAINVVPTEELTPDAPLQTLCKKYDIILSCHTPD